MVAKFIFFFFLFVVGIPTRLSGRFRALFFIFLFFVIVLKSFSITNPLDNQSTGWLASWLDSWLISTFSSEVIDSKHI